MTADTMTAVRSAWVTAYTDFVLAALGLKALLDEGAPVGVSQQVLAAKAVRLLELADTLAALGQCPAVLFAGEEEALWRAAVRYGGAACWDQLSAGGPIGDVVRAAEECRAEWDAFCRAVSRLPGGFGPRVPALDPEALRPHRLPRLFHPAPRRCGRGEDEGQAVAQRLDEAVPR